MFEVFLARVESKEESNAVNIEGNVFYCFLKNEKLHKLWKNEKSIEKKNINWLSNENDKKMQ
jgi:hypothetical protein